MSSSKENILNSLEKLGWHLNPESIDEFLAENPKIGPNDVVKKALNCDLRSIGAKYLAEDAFQGKCDKFEANIVLQLAKLRNIAAPKENENSNTAPRMFKVALTDGTTNCNGLVLGDIPKLNLNTAPGTKVYLKGSIKVKCALLLLDNRNTEILGGEVDYMVAKWKANKDLSNHVRAFCQTDNPPPPWVPFGIKTSNLVDTSKKVFAEAQQKEENESSEFSQARQAALAEALEAKSKVTKTFTQLPIDKSQVAGGESSSSSNQNHLHPRMAPVQTKPDEITTEKKGRKPFRKGRRGGDRSDEEEYADVRGVPKPKEATLFDAFKNKLDINDDQDAVASGAEPLAAAAAASSHQNYYEREREPTQRYGRGRGGGRFQRRFQDDQATMSSSKSTQPKQQYNLNDFNYDLDGGKVATAATSQKLASSNTAATARAAATEGASAATSSSGTSSGQQTRQNNYNNNRQQGNKNYDNNRNRQQQQYQQPRNQQYQQQQQQQHYEFQQSFQPPPAPPAPVQPQYYYPPPPQPPMPNQNMFYQPPPSQAQPPLQPMQYQPQFEPQQFNYDYPNQYQPYQQQQQRTFYNNRGGGRGGRGGGGGPNRNYNNRGGDRDVGGGYNYT